MKKQNLQELAEIMAVVGDVHGKEISKPLINLYFEQLKQFSISDISKAFSKPSKWFPKPFDIIEAIQGSASDIKEIENTALKIKAGEQADMVLQMIDNIGSDARPLFNDPITGHIMSSIFNWRTWGRQHLTKNNVFFRRDFVEYYLNYDKVGEIRQLTHEESKKLLERI